MTVEQDPLAAHFLSALFRQSPEFLPWPARAPLRGESPAKSPVDLFTSQPMVFGFGCERSAGTLQAGWFRGGIL
jgi:hypothetical protein